MPTSPKPTILLVPGAWHSPSHYATLLSHLQAAGYHTVCSRLPSVASADPLTATAAQDASFIREKMLLPLLEQENDILLVLHSYGGLPGSAAAKDLSKSERTKQGKKGGIIGLVLMAALMAREGDSLEQMMGGKLHGWVAVDEVSGTSTVPDPVPIFYGDVSASIAATASAELLTHALLAFRTPSPPSAWGDSVYDGRRAYIYCVADDAIIPMAQKAMLDHSGVEWDVRELKSGHSPQLSMPDKVAELVLELAAAWAGGL